MLDCVVIGAGAAGIGAGLALLRAKANFLVLEAKDRVGGRAYSCSDDIGQLWDHGCHWFHSASKNPLRKIALKLGHGFEDRAKDYSSAVFRAGARHSIAPLYDAFGAVMARVAAGGDVALSEHMVDASALNTLLRHEFALNTSHEMEEISARDICNFDDTGENIPVTGGYGVLMARLASALPVKLFCAVRAIDVRADHVRMTTHDGVIEARSVVLAVPQRILERGNIAITPRLPDELQAAIEAVPLGWFEKTAFAFDREVFDAGEGLGVEILADIGGKAFPGAVGIFPGAPRFAVFHTGGHLARDLAEADRMALCEEALVQCFGSQLRARIARRASTRWTVDPHIGGAYSMAKPGFAHVRERFSAPIHERVMMAGEHTSTTAMATAHGAYVSGVEAAQRALAAMGRAQALDPLWVPDGA